MHTQNRQTFDGNTSKTALAGQASNNVPVWENQPQKTRTEAAHAMLALREFIGRGQRVILEELLKCEEAPFFRDKVCELAGIVNTMPTTYETDGEGEEAIAWLHYFGAGGDWFITERDRLAEQLQAFGRANLDGFGEGKVLGYISIRDILDWNEAELDLHWTPKRLSEI